MSILIKNPDDVVKVHNGDMYLSTNGEGELFVRCAKTGALYVMKMDEGKLHINHKDFTIKSYKGNEGILLK